MLAYLIYKMILNFTLTYLIFVKKWFLDLYVKRIQDSPIAILFYLTKWLLHVSCIL